MRSVGQKTRKYRVGFDQCAHLRPKEDHIPRALPHIAALMESALSGCVYVTLKCIQILAALISKEAIAFQRECACLQT